MPKYFITGGAGFIGAALSARLIEDPDNEVHVLDNLWRNSMQYYEILEKNDRFKCFLGDVTNLRDMSKVAEGTDYVIHMASIAGVDTVMARPYRTAEVASVGTLNALEVAAANDVKLFIDFSTSEVYGMHAIDTLESEPTVIPAVGRERWVYAAAKLASEHMVWAFGHDKGIPTCGIRPFNIYGPGQVGSGAVQIFINRAIRDLPIPLQNGGHSIRDWCYIDDMTDAIVSMLDIPEKVNGKVFNIGNGKNDNVLKTSSLAKMIVDLTESKSVISNIEWNHPDVNIRIADVSLARDTFGYNPKVDLKKGLLKTIEWYRSIANG